MSACAPLEMYFFADRLVVNDYIKFKWMYQLKSRIQSVDCNGGILYIHLFIYFSTNFIFKEISHLTYS